MSNKNEKNNKFFSGFKCKLFSRLHINICGGLFFTKKFKYFAFSIFQICIGIAFENKIFWLENDEMSSKIKQTETN